MQLRHTTLSPGQLLCTSLEHLTNLCLTKNIARTDMQLRRTTSSSGQLLGTSPECLKTYRLYAFGVRTFVPPMYGHSTSGTVTEPSACR